MESYSKLIQRALGNGTPKEQYENLEKIIEFLENIAFPKRGSSAETWDIEDASREAEKLLNDLKPK
jgi:hypothetical protein